MTNTAYSPGLHKLLTLRVKNIDKLTNLNGFKNFSDGILLKYGLEEVGFSSHVFENGSYTAAYCLKESHLCIHTWPEFNQLTMDVYLCNYLKDNSDKVRAIANEYIVYFEAEVIKDFEINR
ncbi:S-adenosylmethionine decarboxylase family protein [Flavobacterium beibuense]|uniref:Adenosylmethionine decarboxylase n=1 Tax=Flavobacterium beibuense TaxID=657326 RepID=A0A444WBN8_9FLAO|nr:S-adenosylmethionine decarboxylase [Flavobacterium beibuense]RYJ43247.1 Adenosylmethionine decarboxylase [Flavobacterium beibuense]